jgi:hypothetical protein
MKTNTEDSISLDDLHNQEELPTLKKEDENEDLTQDLEEGKDEENKEGVGTTGDEENSQENEEEVLTGIEKYLTSNGIEGGIIEFEDGTKKHYNDLTQDEQFNVLKSIAENEKITIEEKFELDADEIGVLNYLRESKKPVAEALEDLVEAEINRRAASSSDIATDFLKLSDEAVYLKWLKNSDPESTDEDLQEALDAAKKNKSFTKQASNIRAGFISEQERLMEVESAKIQEEQRRELEADRETIVNVVSELTNVAGWEITDAQKNDVLASLLETNSQGDSLFMEKVFSDPKKLFEVAWMEKFGNDYYDKMGEYYKNEISAAYARGKKEGITGLPAKPIKTGGSEATRENVNPAGRENNNAIGLEELHQD